QELSLATARIGLRYLPRFVSSLDFVWLRKGRRPMLWSSIMSRGRRQRTEAVIAIAVAAVITAALSAQEPRWFSAWSAAHNVGLVVDGLDGGSVRLIVRPTLSGRSLRVKFANTRANTPAVFSSAFVGVAGSGAAIVPGTSRRLTFSGAQGLTLAPEESAWSDAVAFDVKA